MSMWEPPPRVPIPPMIVPIAMRTPTETELAEAKYNREWNAARKAEQAEKWAQQRAEYVKAAKLEDERLYAAFRDQGNELHPGELVARAVAAFTKYLGPEDKFLPWGWDRQLTSVRSSRNLPLPSDPAHPYSILKDDAAIAGDPEALAALMPDVFSRKLALGRNPPWDDAPIIDWFIGVAHPQTFKYSRKGFFGYTNPKPRPGWNLFRGSTSLRWNGDSLDFGSLRLTRKGKLLSGRSNELETTEHGRPEGLNAYSLRWMVEMVDGRQRSKLTRRVVRSEIEDPELLGWTDVT